ncbi:MAG TPA: histidine phosphatase family protein, partial [Candidatus Paceibacterota bacterium]
AFGADDYELSTVFNLPFIQHVTTSGVFKPEVSYFRGQHVKPKDTLEDKAQKIESHQKGDIEIIKYLARKDLIFAKEKIIHSYPHCWRCDTPLINYASSSWFVKVTLIRDKLVKENKKIKWIPEELGDGRFGNWLLGARDWAISRSRFWGAPLPVWRDEKTKDIVIIGSLDELKRHSKAKNTYYAIRHGEAESNAKGILSSRPENPHHLTKKGRVQVLEAAKWLKDKKIDIIFTSPFVRTRETAEIISKNIGLDPACVLTENAISELNVGIWEGTLFAEFQRKFSQTDRFDMRFENGESYIDVKKRMGDFIYSLEKKYEGKNILIISHDSPLFLLVSAVGGLTRDEALNIRGAREHYADNAKPFALCFTPLPHNEN